MTSIGNISASDFQSLPQISSEGVVQFLAGGAAYKTLGAESHIQEPWSDPNAAMDPLVVQTPAQKPLGAFGMATGRPALRARLARPAQFHVSEPSWLADALAALAEVDDEIAEEELPQVSDATKAEAERIMERIRDLEGRSPAPTVYPTQDAEIALHFKAPGRTGTVVILLSDGVRADCHAYVGGTSRRAHYDTSSDLPDAFVLDQLRRLTQPTRAAVSTPNASSLPVPNDVPADDPPLKS